MREVAMQYVRVGMRVLPLQPRSKVPVGRWAHLQDEPLTVETVGQAFEPDYNIGIMTGAGVIVLDVDGPKGRSSLNGLHLPETPVVSTGGGGWHYYFRVPGGRDVGNAVGVLPGVDIRGTGGYVVAPPSVHPSGDRYEWVPGLSITDVPMAEAPQWLIAALERRQSFGPNRPETEWDRLLAGPVPEGQRNDALARLAGRWLGLGTELHEVLCRAEDWAARRCKPPLPVEEVHRTVYSIAAREHRRRLLKGGEAGPAGLPQKGGETNVLKVKVFPQDKGTLKAFAQVTIADMVTVNGLRVLDGKNGLFVAMPQEKGKDDKYYDIAHPVSKEAREQLQSAVLDAYKEAVKDKEAIER